MTWHASDLGPRFSGSFFKHEAGVTLGEAGYWLGCSNTVSSFGGVEEEEDPVSCNQEVRSVRGDFGYD